MVIRYAFLVAVAAAAVWGVVNLGTSNAGMYLVDASQPGATPTNVSFWVLASVATLMTLSLCRFVIFGLPSMVDGWYRDNKSWFFTILLGGAAYGYFYLM
jgi:hypothetical protein